MSASVTLPKWGDIEDELPIRLAESKHQSTSQCDSSAAISIAKTPSAVKSATIVSKRAMERKSWIKFGAAPHDSSNVTYLSNEEVTMEDPSADKNQPGNQISGSSSIMPSKIMITCSRCGMKNDHWTLKCPFRDSMHHALGADHINKAGESGYCGGSSQDDRDSATLRVTNISPDTREDDLKDLFRAFGPVARVYLAKDRETFQSRGFAFVSFMYREDAERAMNKLQGYGYDHLILKIEWAKPSNKPAGESQDPGSMSTTFRSGCGKALPQNNAAARR